MDATTGIDGEAVVWRAAIAAAWLGPGAECRLSERRLVLQGAATGARAAVALEESRTVERDGRRPRVRTTHGRWSGFAGVAFDGWYEIALGDDGAAAELAERLAGALTASGGPAGWWGLGTRLAEQGNLADVRRLVGRR